MSRFAIASLFAVSTLFTGLSAQAQGMPDEVAIPGSNEKVTIILFQLPVTADTKLRFSLANFGPGGARSNCQDVDVEISFHGWNPETSELVPLKRFSTTLGYGFIQPAEFDRSHYVIEMTDIIVTSVQSGGSLHCIRAGHGIVDGTWNGFYSTNVVPSTGEYIDSITMMQPPI